MQLPDDEVRCLPVSHLPVVRQEYVAASAEARTTENDASARLFLENLEQHVARGCAPGVLLEERCALPRVLVGAEMIRPHSIASRAQHVAAEQGRAEAQDHIQIALANLLDRFWQKPWF